MADRTPPDSLPAQVSDIIASTKAYALQETIGPIKHAVRGIAYGIAGALLLGIGGFLLLLGLLRLLQTETWESWGRDGWMSALPYLATAAVALAVAGLAAFQIGRHEVNKEKRAMRSAR